MRKTETAIQRCKTMSTLQKILGGKWKLEYSTISPLMTSIDLESCAASLVKLQSHP